MNTNEISPERVFSWLAYLAVLVAVAYMAIFQSPGAHAAAVTFLRPRVSAPASPASPAPPTA